MNKTMVILLASFVLLFAAGAAVGHLTTEGKPHRRRDSWLTDELNLTPPQREQMRAIWSEAMGQMHGAHRELRRELAEERDQALRDLLTEEQARQYEQILQDYERKLGELAQQREAAFGEAVERTKAMLQPEQRQKYEEILTRMRERGPRRGGRPGHRSEWRRPPSRHDAPLAPNEAP